MMNKNKHKKISQRSFGIAEGLELEFKRAANRLPANFFETVCVFLNMDGGSIVLGVDDDGVISGVNPDAIERIKTDIANLSNNPEKISPPYLLFPHEEEIDGKWVIKVQVPISSQVHETCGKVFLRSEDGDYRIQGVNRIAGLLNRKLGIFTEQKVYPHLGMADLDPKLFEKAKRLMLAGMPKHPWADLPPEELLKVAGFVRKNDDTGEPAYTLAAGLMFGFDSTIQELVPGYKFDALLRRRDTERYDDRLIIRTNLIDAFDLLMGFVEKHINDPFYMEGTQSISLRTIIFRELVANLIAHREYVSVSPATMMIYRDRVEFKNPNVPHYFGRIDPKHFTPFPKNPTICKFMLQMGRYEELGSGVHRVNQYLPHYAPGASRPVFEDGDMFAVTVSLAELTGKVGAEVESGVKSGVESGVESGAESGVESEMAQQIRSHLQKGPLAKSEIAKCLGKIKPTRYLNDLMVKLLQSGLVEYTIPDKPNSRLQKYRLTEKGILNDE